MRPSRGMGCINEKKMPGSKPRVITRKDDPNKVDVYKEGGKVKLPGFCLLYTSPSPRDS